MAKEETTIKLEEQKINLQIEQIKAINTFIDKVLPFVKEYFNAKMKKVEAPRFKWTFIIFGSILLVSVGLTGFLTFHRKISSENFTFVLGILIGSTITLIGDIVINTGITNGKKRYIFLTSTIPTAKLD